MGELALVYRSKLGDCTNGGISATAQWLTIVNVPGCWEPTDDAPAAIIDSHGAGIVRVVPAELVDGKWKPSRPDETVGPMAGGNYLQVAGAVGTAVERLLGHRFYGAVAIHDRFETPEQYDQMSR